MEDAKLIQLHETLKKYQPKGKIGGLGFGGGAFGAPKKKDDGLPKNGLYSFFVRAGEGGYKRWDDNEEEKGKEEPQQQPEAATDSEGKKKRKKEGKKKKATKKAEKKRQREAAAAAAAEPEDEPVPAPAKASKRLRSESLDQNPQEAEGGGGATATATATAAFAWEKHIKAALKGAEGRAMPVKALRRHVMALAQAHPEAGRQKKKALKQAFHGAVDAHAKLHVDEDTGVVAYGRKKGKEVEKEVVKEVKAVETAAAVPKERASRKKGRKDRKKAEQQ